MISADGAPRVIEFNCRFGDPETQPIMLRLRSDLVDLCEAALDGALGRQRADWDPRPAMGVVLAAGGYPGQLRQGAADRAVSRADEAPTICKVFHAGTALPTDKQRGDHQRRSRAVRHGPGRGYRRGPERCYAGVEQHRLGGHAVPPRHWLARNRAL
jgi:phosphoribosylamine-glycine ligase